MKYSLKLLLALAGLALLVSPGLRADEPAASPADKPDRHERRGDNLKELTKELNLTADQQAQIKATRQQTRDAIKALHDDTSLSQDQKRAKMKELRKGERDQVEALLTPDQLPKFKELRGRHSRPGEKPPVD
jgi:protein CpxP